MMGADAPAAVAIVEDDALTRTTLSAWLAKAGFRAIDFEDAGSALAALPGECSVVCLDLGLDDAPGMHLLAHLRARDPDTPILVITGDKRIDSAVEALRAGASDYLVKPVDAARLVESVRAALKARAERERRRRRPARESAQNGIVGRSAPMREVARLVERIAESDVSVCIFGESGTGKELVARAVHAAGRRKKGPFVAVNCAAIPESLQESELFGHEAGAFTGAVAQRAGRFEQAHGGTLFLDELGEMSLATQASLLRALQERVIRRVGGSREVPVDVRVVAATHRDLAEDVKAGRFREDLYFRLVVYPVRVPPLRERTDDLPLLVQHFLDRFASDVRRPVRRVSADALARISRYAWPGNVRELQNVVHRAMLAADDAEIGVDDLPPEVASATGGPIAAEPEKMASPRADDEPIVTLAEIQKRAIERALLRASGNIGRAAQLLGIGRATLYRQLAKDPAGEDGDP